MLQIYDFVYIAVVKRETTLRSTHTLPFFLMFAMIRRKLKHIMHN